jgi:hypothetical protein
MEEKKKVRWKKETNSLEFGSFWELTEWPLKAQKLLLFNTGFTSISWLLCV